MFALALVLGGSALAGGALAAPAPSTRLVECGAQSCLRVSGYRDDAARKIRVNGYAVAAQGGRRWTVDLPLDTVRAWSAPHAREIEISLEAPASAGASADPGATRGARETVALPIGLLGGVTDLESLVISAG